jgi:glycosyltransferase involved in cell wall biosynthesis
LQLIKVLYVSAGAERGGVEVVLLNTVLSLDRARFKPVVLFLRNGPFVNEVKATGTETHVIEAGRVRHALRGAGAVRRTVALIREEGINLVHSHNAVAHIYGGMAALFAGVRSLFHLHGVPKPAASREGFLDLLSVTVPAGRTLACSNYVATAFRRAWFSRRPISVVHNGTFPPELAIREVPSVAKEFGIPNNGRLVLMAARLQRWKGVHIFVDAAAIVTKSHPEARFMIVGGALFGLEQEYPLQLRRQIDALRLTNVVQLVGHRPDISRFYLAADVVVHCSIEPEPFAMVILEALACARPVIASDSGGTSEIIENDVTGLLVPPNDPQRLAQTIVSLLDYPERAVRMGQAGAARVRDSFTAAQMTQRLERIYMEMVAGTIPVNGTSHTEDAP